MYLSLFNSRRNSNNNLLNMKTPGILVNFSVRLYILYLYICYSLLVTLHPIKFHPTEKAYFRIASFTFQALHFSVPQLLIQIQP